MRITGGQIIKVSAEKIDLTGQNTGSTVNITLNNVRVDKDKLFVNYTYMVDYAPNSAKLTVTGELHASEDEKTLKEAMKMWNEKKMLPEEMASELITSLTYTGSAVGTLLAFAVGIPSPISVQRAKIQNPKPQQKAA